MLPNEKIFTVPNCVDDEYLMSDEEFEEKIRTLPERKVKHVLYLSNFIRSKGYPEVLKMAKLEKERGGERPSTLILRVSSSRNLKKTSSGDI